MCAHVCLCTGQQFKTSVDFTSESSQLRGGGGSYFPPEVDTLHHPRETLSCCLFDSLTQRHQFISYKDISGLNQSHSSSGVEKGGGGKSHSYAD